MKGGKRRWYLLAVGAAVLAYQCVFPKPLGRELQLTPLWTASVEDTPGKELRFEATDPTKTQAYRLQNYLGYVDQGGGIRFQEAIAHGVALHDDFFISYTSQPRSLVIRSPDGRFLATIPESGYPFIRRDRLFLISADGFTLSEWTIGGEKIWTRTFASLITSMDAGKELAGLGLLDGRVLFLDGTGEDIFAPPVPESRHLASYLVSISGDDRYLATVQGIRPQTLRIFEKNSRSFKLLFSRELDGDFRRPLKGGFFTASSHFLVEQAQGLGVFTPRWKRFTTVLLPGTLRGLGENPRNEMLFALSQQGERFFLNAFLPSGKEVLHFSYPWDPSYFLGRRGEDLLLGRGKDLFYIQVGRG